jgi:hypothetical protein
MKMIKRRQCGHFVSEQMLRIHKRIDVIEFCNTYAIAQDNPNAFLQLTAKKVSGNSSRNVAPRKGRKDSMVKRRFIDIFFSNSVVDGHNRAVSDMYNSAAQKHKPRNKANSAAKKHDLREKASQKIEGWRRNGKPWAEMVRRFGYGILLLVPRNRSGSMSKSVDKSLCLGAWRSMWLYA